MTAATTTQSICAAPDLFVCLLGIKRGISCPADLAPKSLASICLLNLHQHILSFFIHSTTITRTTLKLRQIDSMASIIRSPGRQTKKTLKIRENDALAPVLLKALPTTAQHLIDKGIPQFEPLQRLPFISITVRVPIITLLQLFLLLLGEGTLLVIVSATNAYATLIITNPTTTEFHAARPWHPLTRNELIVWLGTLFHMGRHPEFNREYHWESGTPGIGRLRHIIAKNRWEQIHRFFKISPKSERQSGQPWWYKVDPLLTTVRRNIKDAVFPAN